MHLCSCQWWGKEGVGGAEEVHVVSPIVPVEAYVGVEAHRLAVAQGMMQRNVPEHASQAAGLPQLRCGALVVHLAPLVVAVRLSMQQSKASC